MKTYYYNLDDGAFIYPSGDRCNAIPELFYQDQTVWRIALRDRKDRPVDISGITAWGAAIDNNYCSGSAPMCRTLSERITADVESGAVEVAIDAATPEFLAAVNGVSVKPAFFELYGLNAVGERVLSLCFEIRTRMTLDPDPSIGGEIPEAIATKNYAAAVAAGSAGAVSATLRGDLDARPTSSGARQIASAVAQSGGYVDYTGARKAASDYVNSGAYLTSSGGSIIAANKVSTHNTAANAHAELFGTTVQCVFDLPVDIPAVIGRSYLYIGSQGAYLPGHIYQAVHEDDAYGWRDLTPATSGAIFSNTEIDTQIGAYHFRATSGGGLVVSGSGASVVLSGGQIMASAGSASAALLNSEVKLAVSGGASVNLGGANPEDISLYSPGGEISMVNPGGGSVTVNNRPVATQLVTSTNNQPYTVIGVLSGGTSYVATEQPQEYVEVTSVVKTNEASYVHFRLDSVTNDPPVVISGVSYLNSATFEGGKEYLVGIFDGMAVVNEVTSGGVLQ